MRWFRLLDLDPRTIESYRSRLRCHILPKFGHLPLGAITTLGVTEWARSWSGTRTPRRRRAADSVQSGAPAAAPWPKVTPGQG
ncbi:hypothetical protein ACIRSS_35000 [Amycolatopsis sp. NPDC101161]|uniref:hypothetical protein n=1 Tax=Amycolatopsis sp. NPDC101161 TaxID=3363940 RepID=UPI00381C5B3B